MVALHSFVCPQKVEKPVGMGAATYSKHSVGRKGVRSFSCKEKSLSSCLPSAVRLFRGACHSSIEGKRSSTIVCAMSETYLTKAGRLAWLRAEKSHASTFDLFNDVYASELASAVVLDSDLLREPLGYGDAFEIISAKLIDDVLIKATAMVNMNRDQEYRQVVLIGDGMCTRYCRLPWPAGTIIYCVAPAEVHERAEAILKSKGANAPRGCLFRRISYDFEKSEPSLLDLLEDQGFRGDRLAVWALQGVHAMGLSWETLTHLCTDISNGAAFESIILGELPESNENRVENFMADFGWIGACIPLETVLLECCPSLSQSSQIDGEALPWWAAAAKNLPSDPNKDIPRIFRANQRRVSIAEMEQYESHVEAAQEMDEDFFGNFS